MIHSTMILEDLVLVTTVRNSVIDVYACDNLTGESIKDTWTREQYRAVMFLIADADDNILGSTLINEFYEIAITAIVGWPNSCRPFP